MKNHVEVVVFLCSRGAAPNAVTHDGATPLHWASLKGSYDCVKYLLEKTSASPLLATLDGFTPLHYTCICTSSGTSTANEPHLREGAKIHIARLLLCDYGAPVDAVNEVTLPSASCLISGGRRHTAPLRLFSGQPAPHEVPHQLWQCEHQSQRQGPSFSPLLADSCPCLSGELHPAPSLCCSRPHKVCAAPPGGALSIFSSQRSVTLLGARLNGDSISPLRVR
jgi:hypothetical protein